MKPLLSITLASLFSSLAVADLRISGCNAEMEGMIRSAMFDEIPKMLSNTSERLTAFYRDSISQGHGDTQVRGGGPRQEEQSFQDLFRSLVSRTAGPRTGVHNWFNLRKVEETERLIRRVNKTVSVVHENIQALAGQSKNLEISCSPSWLERDTVRGEPSINPDLYRDTRTLAGHLIPISVPGGQNTLAAFSRPSLETMLIFNDLHGAYPSVILLNGNNEANWKEDPIPASAERVPYDDLLQWNWEDFRMMSNMGASLSFVYNKYLEGRVKLDDVIPHHLSSILLWGLFQTATIATDLQRGALPLDDNTCFFTTNGGHTLPEPGRPHPAFGSHATHGWLCLTGLANRSPVRATKNPTTLQYLVTAAYLRRFDWSLGVSRDLQYVDRHYPQISSGSGSRPWVYPNIPTDSTRPEDSHRPPGTSVAGPSRAIRPQQDDWTTNPQHLPLSNLGPAPVGQRNDGLWIPRQSQQRTGLPSWPAEGGIVDPSAASGPSNVQRGHQTLPRPAPRPGEQGYGRGAPYGAASNQRQPGSRGTERVQSGQGSIGTAASSSQSGAGRTLFPPGFDTGQGVEQAAHGQLPRLNDVLSHTGQSDDLQLPPMALMHGPVSSEQSREGDPAHPQPSPDAEPSRGSPMDEGT